MQFHYWPKVVSINQALERSFNEKTGTETNAPTGSLRKFYLLKTDRKKITDAVAQCC